MRFQVKFTTKFNRGALNENPAFFPSRKLGLDGIRMARAINPNISAGKVANTIDCYKLDEAIELTELEAEQTRLFECTDFVTVEVPSLSLNKFVGMQLVSDNTLGNFSECELKHGEYKLKYVLNITKLVSEWASNGYPTKWDVIPEVTEVIEPMQTIY